MVATTPIQVVSLFLMGFLISLMERANGHGHMSVPPMRSSMWHYGFATPPNYDDNQLWCGLNHVQCSECGDNWGHVPDPTTKAASTARASFCPDTRKRMSSMSKLLQRRITADSLNSASARTSAAPFNCRRTNVSTKICSNSKTAVRATTSGQALVDLMDP